MKLIKIIGHPVLVISLFLLVIIEGVHFGGFYLIYLLFGLMYAAPFALLAVAGIITLLIGYNLYKEKKLMKAVLYFIGWLLLLLSYVVFFGDGKSNNAETFQTTVPILTFVLFGLSSFCFLLYILLVLKSKGNGKQKLKVA